MDKKEALKILIEHSFVFTKDVQEKLIAGIPAMTLRDVDALGKLLASLKQKSIISYDADMKKINQMILVVEKEKGSV